MRGGLVIPTHGKVCCCDQVALDPAIGEGRDRRDRSGHVRLCAANRVGNPTIAFDQLESGSEVEIRSLTLGP